MKSLNRMVDILLMIAVFFLYPLLFFGLKQDSLIRTAADASTNSLVEYVRSNGYIDKEMYEEYLQNLSKTGLTYQLSFEHRLNVLEPEYRFRTPEEIIEAQDAAYTGSNIYNHWPVTTEIPIVTDPVYTGSLNTETNASVLASAVNTGAAAGHIHTDACYTGHKHNDKPTSFTWTHRHADGYKYNGDTRYCQQYVSRVASWGSCASCGNLQNYFTYEMYWDEARRQAVLSYSASDSTCDKCGRSWNPVNYYDKSDTSYSCGFRKDLDGDGYYDPVDWGTTYSYGGFSGPQAPSIDRAFTQSYGCWTYHTHGSLPMNQYGSWLQSLSYINYFNLYGSSSYCMLPSSLPVFYHYSGYANTYPLDFYSAIVDGKVKYSFYVGCPTGGGVLSTSGLLSKQYLEPDELYSFCYGNFLKQVYEWFIDKNSALAKSFLKEAGAYNSYDDWGNAIYVEGKPIIGYWFRYAIGSGSSDYLGMPYNAVSNCNLAYGWSYTCGKVGDSTIDCGVMVTGIIPTHPTQTVYRNDQLITTVAATHVDGSITTVVASTNFSTSNLCQNQTVTLSYTFTVDGTTYTKTCTITVTVVPRNKTCARGHTYNLNTDGSDPGCPYCKAWLLSLSVVTPSNGKLSIFRGTTLEENGVEVKAIYLDGHAELLTEGYLSNLDSNYIGIQTVTIGYKGKSVSIQVTVKRNLTKCTVCGRFYELHPDDSDPGCPYCAARTPIFTGNILHYKKEEYTNDILKELYDGEGIYYLNRGDFFKVTLMNSSRSLGGRMTAALYKDMADETIRIEYSGVIREDGQ